MDAKCSTYLNRIENLQNEARVLAQTYPSHLWNASRRVCGHTNKREYNEGQTHMGEVEEQNSPMVRKPTWEIKRFQEVQAVISSSRHFVIVLGT